MAALLGVFLAFVAPGAALAQAGEGRLALRSVGQAGSFFDLSMRPGETRTLRVEIANTGDASLAARTYAADVYTIVNGGFGRLMGRSVLNKSIEELATWVSDARGVYTTVNGGFGGRLRGEPRTGTTRWLDYATAVLQLPAGQSVRRSFAVTVPADAGPGEYITSIVLENDQAIRTEGSVVLDQVIRQAIAVVVTVPGPRSPGLAIGTASHKVVAGRSVVSVAVENTGNVRLKPDVDLTLFDASGAEVSHASVQMDTFYARTDTFVEVPLASLLLPGTYTVRLGLVDPDSTVRADAGSLTFAVDAPVESAGPAGAVPGLTAVNQAPGDGRISLPVGPLEVAAAVSLAGLFPCQRAGGAQLFLRRALPVVFH